MNRQQFFASIIGLFVARKVKLPEVDPWQAASTPLRINMVAGIHKTSLGCIDGQYYFGGKWSEEALTQIQPIKFRPLFPERDS